MAVRIKEWMIPYTWWIWIEVTDNHVINVLLRELNNLIQVNEDRELYVDLQLEDWIQPEDDFPVGVTTWKILQEDWWDQSGIILNWKTTSGDYVRLIYANDWKLYYDPWTWVWVEIGWWGWQTIGVATSSTLWTVKLGSDTVQTAPAQSPSSDYWKTFPVQLNSSNQAVVNVPYPEYSSLVEENGWTDESLVTTGEKYIWNHKQDTLTAGTRITIQNGVISADVSGVMTYKWNVTDETALPSSGNTVWDCWYAEQEKTLYAWDWTQWNDVGWVAIDLTNYFNKNTDDSDDITEWSTHLFVSTAEKNKWNAKQDALTAGENITISNQNVISSTSYTEWTGIDITNHVVTNTLPFEPENQWSLSQVLKRTSTGYRWENESWWGWGWHTYYAGDGIAINNYVISNTAKFEPWTWTTGQVLKKTADGYAWGNESGAEQDVRVWNIPQDGFSQSTMQEITQWLLDAGNLKKSAILKSEQSGNINLYIYGRRSTLNNTASYHFYWMWEKHEKNTTSANGDFTTMYNTEYVISFDWTTYTWQRTTSSEPNGNYLTVEDSGYTTPYMPTASYQPATKAYVDAVAAGSVSVWAITNNTTGTTSTIQQEWVGTQAEYDLITPLNWVIYNILPSS